jgi:osmotically-inducible protein OsmY
MPLFAAMKAVEIAPGNNHARMIARRLQALRHRIAGSRTREARPSKRDASLSRRLFNTFERDLELVQIQGIHFYVQESVVTLYGTVRHEVDRELLVSLVREIAGVKGVVAHLQLVEPRFRQTAEAEKEVA